MVTTTNAGTTDSNPSFEAANELFHTTRRRIAGVVVADRLWKRRLNSTEKTRLGGSFSVAMETHPSAARMWEYLKGVSYQRAVIEVGESIGFLTTDDANWLLREGGELPRDPNEAYEQAILREDLVLNRQQPALYWRGHLVEVDWTRYSASWRFFLVVCEHAKQNQPVDRFSFGETARANIVTQEKSRLKSIRGFPLNLIECFELVGTGTQRLAIPAERIYIH